MRRAFLGLALLMGAITVGPGGTAAASEYSLTLDQKVVSFGSQTGIAVTINGALPGPTLRFREGEDVVVHVTNNLPDPSSIHWHGILLPAAMDGVPGLNRFAGIKHGETLTYRFTPRQSGTYWYHSHSGLQEQQGLYGALVIDPKGADPVRSDRDYIVLLSDFPKDAPGRVLANLKADSDYYNYGQRTIGDFFADASRDGLGATIRDRLTWGRMRMGPTDLSDISGYTFLVNAKPPEANETFLFKPGERVRLRFIAGGSMTYFDVHIPGLKMTVVAADGQNVVPVPVDEFRIAPGETYDVIVEPQADQAFTLFAQSVDRTGYARATLAPRQGMSAPVPAVRPRAVLTMADMPGMSDAAPIPAADTMDAMPGMTADAAATSMPDMDMSGAADPSAGHASGWSSGFPADERVLGYADLKSLTLGRDMHPPDKDIVLHLTGNMQRYIWTLDGKKFGEASPLALHYGERVKVTFVNDTMMAHPMHLHGMYMELLNGQPPGSRPLKHTVNVPPGQSVSVLITADALGEWAFHCHLFYHMATGMMTTITVAPPTASAAP